MDKKRKAVRRPPKLINAEAKITDEKDISKVFRFFRYTTGTTLDCMLSTGILRNSITYHVRELERMGLLQDIYRMPDAHTKRTAKYYSADKTKWTSTNNRQLSLFDERRLSDGI